MHEPPVAHLNVKLAELVWSLWPCCRLFRSTSVLSYSDWVGSQTGKLKDQVNTPTIVNSLDVLNEEVIVSKKKIYFIF